MLVFVKKNMLDLPMPLKTFKTEQNTFFNYMNSFYYLRLILLYIV